MARVKAGELRVKDAAAVMRVSYRQAKRLWKRYQSGGTAALKHGNAGRNSHRAWPMKDRRKILKLVREKYSGDEKRRFGPTLATEHLASEDHLEVHPETLRRWMLRKGCGARLGNVSRIGRGASGGRTSGNWCSWTAVSTIGIKDVARGPA